MIFTECDADTEFIKILTEGRVEVIHENGRSGILNLMKEKYRDGDRVVGVVDEDSGKSQHPDLGNYKTVDEKRSIRLLVKEGDEKKRLIMLCPEFEEWIISRARLNQIYPREYDVPADPRELKKIPHYEKNRNFKDMLLELIGNDSEIRTISEWIKRR
ncbi:MAG: hypothetical protein R6U61_02965 [Thermoplasmata archaeon]